MVCALTHDVLSIITVGCGRRDCCDWPGKEIQAENGRQTEQPDQLINDQQGLGNLNSTADRIAADVRRIQKEKH